MVYFTFFKKWKNKIHQLSKSRQGLFIMAAVCFVEPIFLPMIPEIAVAPIMLARKSEWIKILFIAVLSTLAGSIVAYTLSGLIGKFLLAYMGESVMYLYEQGLVYLHHYGFFLPFIGSLTPFPLKIITWTCGLTRFNFFVLTFGIFSGRLLRYSLIILLQKTHAYKRELKEPMVIKNHSKISV